MIVAELIAKELGVKVGEKFIYETCEYMIDIMNLELVGTNQLYSLNSIIINEMLENKDKIVKISTLADSWDIKNNDVLFYVAYTGFIGSASASDDFISKTNSIYNKNKEYMQLIADKQNLFRKMLKFADCNNEGCNDTKYIVYYSKSRCKWDYQITGSYETMLIYFSSIEVVQKAIEQFEDDLERIRLAEIEIRGN